MDLSILWTIISFIIMFSLIVICHEGGHYLIARANGIKVIEFTIGLGPKIIHFKKGDTEYSLRALPFGGACIFENPDELDEEEEEKENEEKLSEDLEKDKKNISFNDASVFARIATVCAGPFFNIILAFLLAIFVVFFSGENGTTVTDIMEDYPAYKAGIRVGDRITAINNEKVYFIQDIKLMLITELGDKWEVEFERNGQKMSETVSFTDSTQGKLLGIVTDDYIDCRNLKVFKYSALEVRFFLKATFKSLRMLFTGKLNKDDLAGPVGIAKVIDTTIEETKDYGAFVVILNMFNLAVLFNVNLGVMNLLPFPALDGGRLVFLVIEAIIGKKVPKTAEAYIHLAGIVVLLILSVFVLINDITKFFR